MSDEKLVYFNRVISDDECQNYSDAELFALKRKFESKPKEKKDVKK